MPDIEVGGMEKVIRPLLWKVREPHIVDMVYPKSGAKRIDWVVQIGHDEEFYLEGVLLRLLSPVWPEDLGKMLTPGRFVVRLDEHKLRYLDVPLDWVPILRHDELRKGMFLSLSIRNELPRHVPQDKIIRATAEWDKPIPIDDDLGIRCYFPGTKLLPEDKIGERKD